MASMLMRAALLGAAAAQSTTLSIPFYGLDTQSIDALVVSANPSATTMALACPPGTDSNDCGLFPEMTLVYGPSTYHLDMAVGDANAFTGTVDCARGARVTCTESAGGSEANFPGSSTTVYEGEDILTLPVTVTSGAEKLGGVQASPTGSASERASATTSGGTSNASTVSVTHIAGATSASASGASSASSTQSAAVSPSTAAACLNFSLSTASIASAFVGFVASLLL